MASGTSRTPIKIKHATPAKGVQSKSIAAPSSLTVAKPVRLKLGDTIHILVLGDSGVGKSSLISVLVKDTFLRVPHLLSDIQVPPSGDEMLTPHGYGLLIRDTPASVNAEEISANDADVHVLVCTLETVDRVRSHWMPMLERIERPIIIALNKAAVDSRLPPQLSAYFATFRISSLVLCNAKDRYNVSQLFWDAQRAVISPIKHLYDYSTRSLRPSFRKALVRLFRVFDQDCDLLLSPMELNRYHLHCYGRPFSNDQVERLLSMLEQYNVRFPQHPCVVDANGDRYLTNHGFILSYLLLVENHRSDSAWDILHRLGYDLDFQLHPDYIVIDSLQPNIGVVDLSPSALDFIGRLFVLTDTDHDGRIAIGRNGSQFNDLNVLFETLESGVPAEFSQPEKLGVFPDSEGFLNMNQFTALWSVYFRTLPELAMKTFVLLGYPCLPAYHMNIYLTKQFDEAHTLMRGALKVLPQNFAERCHLSVAERRLMHIVIIGQDPNSRLMLLQNLHRLDIDCVSATDASVDNPRVTFTFPLRLFTTNSFQQSASQSNHTQIVVFCESISSDNRDDALKRIIVDADAIFYVGDQSISNDVSYLHQLVQRLAFNIPFIFIDNALGNMQPSNARKNQFNLGSYCICHILFSGLISSEISIKDTLNELLCQIFNKPSEFAVKHKQLVLHSWIITSLSLLGVAGLAVALYKRNQFNSVWQRVIKRNHPNVPEILFFRK